MIHSFRCFSIPQIFRCLTVFDTLKTLDALHFSMAPIRRPDFGFRNSLHSNEELLANTIAPNWVSLSLSLSRTKTCRVSNCIGRIFELNFKFWALNCLEMIESSRSRCEEQVGTADRIPFFFLISKTLNIDG